MCTIDDYIIKIWKYFVFLITKIDEFDTTEVFNEDENPFDIEFSKFRSSNMLRFVTRFVYF